MGLKYDGLEAVDWLVNWLNAPTSATRPRTRMPVPDWQRLAFVDKAEREHGDPVADVAAYLRASRQSPQGDPTPWTPDPLSSIASADRDELAHEAYGMIFNRDDVGVSNVLPNYVSVPTLAALAMPQSAAAAAPAATTGGEDGPPIGPALSDWGRKHVSQLAFEKVDELLEEAAAAG